MPFDLNTPPANNLLFLHIQKTAGSTLHQIIGRQYRRSETFNIYNTIHDLEKFSQLNASEKSQIHLVKGHFPFGLHMQLSGNSEYITILRDPVERTISHYYHAAEDPEHWHYQNLKKHNYSFADVLEKGIMPNLDNNMVRLLSGNNRVAYGECTEAMLETAMQNLKNHFSVIGIQTRFDEFIHQAAARFEWQKSLVYKKMRVGKTRPQVKQLDARTLEMIRSFNKLDQRLYDHWKPIVGDGIRKEGKALEEKIRLFREKNQRYNRYWSWWPERFMF